MTCWPLDAEKYDSIMTAAVEKKKIGGESVLPLIDAESERTDHDPPIEHCSNAFSKTYQGYSRQAVRLILASQAYLLSRRGYASWSSRRSTLAKTSKAAKSPAAGQPRQPLDNVH
jgi:hypothetical protein